MHERLRIHHGVGSRVLFDSDQAHSPFTYEQAGDVWQFNIPIGEGPALAEILRLKDEINLFIFKEENGAAVEKVWFYTGGGEVTYDDSHQCLRIAAASRIAYKPDDFVS